MIFNPNTTVPLIMDMGMVAVNMTTMIMMKSMKRNMTTNMKREKINTTGIANQN